MTHRFVDRGDGRLEVVTDRPLCEWCGSTPAWVYPADDFEIEMDLGGETLTYGSLGDWLACEGCALIIDTGQHDRLLGRVVEKLANRYGVPAAALLELEPVWLRQWEEFERHRTGDSYPFG